MLCTHTPALTNTMYIYILANKLSFNVIIMWWLRGQVQDVRTSPWYQYSASPHQITFININGCLFTCVTIITCRKTSYQNYLQGIYDGFTDIRLFNSSAAMLCPRIYSCHPQCAGTEGIATVCVCACVCVCVCGAQYYSNVAHAPS